MPCYNAMYSEKKKQFKKRRQQQKDTIRTVKNSILVQNDSKNIYKNNLQMSIAQWYCT